MIHDTRNDTQPARQGRHSSAPSTHPSAHRARTSADTRSVERRVSGEPSDASAGGFSRVLRTLPLTLGVTAVAGVLLVTIAAAIAYNSADPSACILPLAYGALGITSLVGGIVAGLCNREQALLGGVVSGSVFVLLVTIASLICSGAAMDAMGGEASPLFSWLARLGVILIHMLGAYLLRARPEAAMHTSSAHQHRYR